MGYLELCFQIFETFLSIFLLLISHFCYGCKIYFVLIQSFLSDWDLLYAPESIQVFINVLKNNMHGKRVYMGIYGTNTVHTCM
jgi:hypothetical protein